VIAPDPSLSRSKKFSTGLLAGLETNFLSADHLDDQKYISALVIESAPDVLILSGWSNRAYRELATLDALLSVPIIMAMDNPALGFRHDWVRRVTYRRFLSCVDAVVVPGDRGRALAAALGFDATRIFLGLYGIDLQASATTYVDRLTLSSEWPKSFVFVGQYTKTKGVDLLLQAYSEYRSAVTDPWPITFCGAGPLVKAVRATEGATDNGFLAPGGLMGELARHGAGVLTSRYDPWPLALVELCAAGLPVLCTQACGSAVETVRDYYNGRILPSDNLVAITEGLTWLHREYERLAQLGSRSRQLAEPYSAELWAERWLAMITSTTTRGSRRAA
jgi:glycosyltransferase involved in cell wall biosynthesis